MASVATNTTGSGLQDNANLASATAFVQRHTGGMAAQLVHGINWGTLTASVLVMLIAYDQGKTGTVPVLVTSLTLVQSTTS